MISAKFRAFDGGVAMRGLVLAAVVFGAVSGAQAADMPDFLRGSLPAGPAPTVNWQGYYIGGQAGYGSSDENFNGSTSNMIAAERHIGLGGGLGELARSQRVRLASAGSPDIIRNGMMWSLALKRAISTAHLVARRRRANPSSAPQPYPMVFFTL